MEHRVLRLWYRPAPGAVPVEVDQLELVAGSGVQQDHTLGSLRHVTVVFADDWALAADEAGAPGLDPVGRRANVLISGSGAKDWIKRWVRLGPVAFEVKGITAPCELMDEYHPGLKAALRPDARAGVWGRLHASGALRVGDLWTESAPPAAPKRDPA